MQTYELTLVLPEKATPAKKKQVTEIIESMIKVFKGKIKSSKDWGKIEFEYKIKKNTSGNFLFFEIELDKDKAKDIDQKLRLEENILRFLLVKKQ